MKSLAGLLFCGVLLAQAPMPFGIGGGGGSGSVTVVSSGNLASGALVTGGGLQTLQTPSPGSALDSSGNMVLPGTMTTGNGSGNAGAMSLVQGTDTSIVANSVGFGVPATITNALRFVFPNAVPATSSFMLLGPNAANETPITYQAFPLPVTLGGLGAATLGANGVVVGQGTSAVHVTSPGAAGQVFTSNGVGVDPTFQAGGGGASTAKVLIWVGSFLATQQSGNSQNASAWQLSNALGFEGCQNTSGGNPPNICDIGLTNAAGQNISYVFIWDTAITAVDFNMVYFGNYTNTGNYRFTGQLICNTLGTNWSSGTWTAGAATTSATFSASSGTQLSKAVSMTSVAVPTCAAGSLMTFLLTRDQSVASNCVDEARLIAGSIVATRTLP